MNITYGFGSNKIKAGVAPISQINLLLSKIALWTSKDIERIGYYVNKIGVQEREVISENGVAGIIQPGRAICYDGSKSQYSRTSGLQPANFRILNNSLTFSFTFRADFRPLAATFIMGNSPDMLSGLISVTIDTYGRVVVVLCTGTDTYQLLSNGDICDGTEHKVLVSFDKTENMTLYIDMVLQNSVDISTTSFGDINNYFYLGGVTGYFSGKKYIRNVRIFNRAIITEADLLSVFNDEYISGCIAWWFMEEGKEGSDYKIKDSIGTNHLLNYAFDSSSLVSGAWPSLLNKFGYSVLEYIGSDLFLGDGNFSDASKWEYSAFGGRWTMNNSTCQWNAADDLANYMMIKRGVTYSEDQYLILSFDVISGTAWFGLGHAYALQSVLAGASYEVGHHDIIFHPGWHASTLGLTPRVEGGAWVIDNVTLSLYETGIIAPKMDSAIPTTDTFGRALTFKDQAKQNLIKVSESVVKFPDYSGELFSACEFISSNNWFNDEGIANEIALDDIAHYQSKKQYYKNEQLIIIKKGVEITDYEDWLIRTFLGVNMFADNSVVVSNLSLAVPYTDVVKITANTDSRFRFNINNNILYTKRDIYNEILQVRLPNAFEYLRANLYKIIRYIFGESLIITNYTGEVNLTGYDSSYSELWGFNSAIGSLCGTIATQYYHVAKMFYPLTTFMKSIVGHTIHNVDGVSVDPGYKYMYFKEKEVPASCEDISEDIDLINEPLKQFNTRINPIYGAVNSYAERFLTVSTLVDAADFSVDNLIMKMPADSYIVMPVKSAIVPKTKDGVDIETYINAVLTIPSGTIGKVEMPFCLLSITGAGTIKVNNITYTLPTNETALKTLFETFNRYYRSFEVLTNTGGIVATFLLNVRRWDLYSTNEVKLETFKGSVDIESIETDIPVPTIRLTVNKGDADSWTLNSRQYFTDSRTILTTMRNFTDDASFITFFGGLTRPQKQQFLNGTPDSETVITAGDSVINQCYSAKLMPRDKVFESSLELSFIPIDDSDIYYTLDHSTPDATKTKYITPFTINASTYVTWVNIKSGYADSIINGRLINKISVPSGLTLSLISGGVKIDWTDTNSGNAQTEIWGRSDSETSALVYTIAAGTVTKNDILTAVDLRYYKIRSKIGSMYSEFTEELSIAMLGAEIITNGTFATDSGWTKGNGQWTISDGKAHYSNSGVNVNLSQSMTIASGKKYRIRIGVSDAIGNAMFAMFYNGSPFCFPAPLNTYLEIPNGNYEYNLVAVASASLTDLYGNHDGSSFSLDNFSVKEILMP